jgi:hypothetical protein
MRKENCKGEEHNELQETLWEDVLLRSTFLYSLFLWFYRCFVLGWTQQKTPFGTVPILLRLSPLQRKLVYRVVTKQRIISSGSIILALRCQMTVYLKRIYFLLAIH